MQKLYEERMNRKRQQYESIKAKQIERNLIREANGYLSAESSEYGVNSFDHMAEEQEEPKTERAQMDVYGGPLISSERPSSAGSFMNPVAVTSRQDPETYRRMQKTIERRRKRN